MRKGWDALSDAYRDRLKRSGINKQVYESGAPLHGARGHTSQVRENFNQQSRRFAKTYVAGREETRVRQQVQAMGAQKGRAYMEDVRKMVRLYESGDTEQAKRLWEGRDQSLPAYLFFYHGLFG